ncbi:MAG: urea ABC transporter ATP-binding subunit UrtE [Pseudomonadota bacterium]
MLEIRGVDSYYGRSQVIHGLSFSADDRSIVAIIGRNGVGKTTLLRTILGLTDRSEGAILLDGEDMGVLDTYARARAGIAYVPQGRHIIPDFTIRDNILMGRFAARSGAKGIPDLVGELFPYLIDNLDRPGGVLSGGQQQQLAIARALAAEPKVLLMDEPTEGIQPNIVEQIEDSIIRLNREFGLTILLVEQNVGFARRAGHAFAMMENGRSVATGAIDTLSDDLVARHMAI